MTRESGKSVAFLIITMVAVFLVNTASNLGSILTIMVLGPMVFLPGNWTASQELFMLIRRWEWLTMVVPSVLVLSFVTPAYIVLYRRLLNRPLGRLKARWILDVPLGISLIGTTGWIVEELLFLVVWFRERSIPLSTVMVNSLQMGLSAVFSFVVSFFCLELLFRRLVIPRAFPDGRLSAVAGNTGFPIRGRFVIYYLSAALFPIFIYAVFILSRTAGQQGFIGYVLMMVVLTLFGLLLTMMLSEYFRGPLRRMKQTVLAIRDGDYDIRLPVVSNDELGLLSESLNDLGRELREKAEMKETFGKVVDPSVRDHLLEGNARLGGEEREVTVLFTDIRNYTGLTERMVPEDVVQWLNRYFDVVAEVITRHGGIVNKYIGDAVMALFGAPREDWDQARHAVEAARAMIAARETLNRVFVEEGLPPIAAGIGIHTGPVLAGNIGSASRLEYTVIGDTVNVASRVEKATKELRLPLLLSETTLERLEGKTGFRKVASCTLRGRSEPVRLFTFS